MLECPKCGHRSIAGPTYVEQRKTFSTFGFLQYRCRRCGYTQDSPTLDQVKARKENNTEKG